MTTPVTISALITERPLCLQCIADKVGLPIAAVDEALTVIGRVVQIFVVPRSPCSHCREIWVTFSIGARPESTS